MITSFIVLAVLALPFILTVASWAALAWLVVWAVRKIRVKK